MKNWRVCFCLIPMIYLLGCTSIFRFISGSKINSIETSTYLSQLTKLTGTTVTPLSKVTSTSTFVTLGEKTTNAPQATTQKPEITYTPEISPEARLKSKCLDISDNLPVNADEKGVIVLKQTSQQSSDITHDFLLDIQTGIRTQLPQKENEGLVYFSVSPDHNWLAYLRGKKGEVGGWLQITDAKGRLYKSIPWREDWWELLQWLDNNNLVIIRRQGDVFSTFIYDPFNGQGKEFLPDYPDIYRWKPNPWWGDYSNSRAVYDPSLTRVVYPENSSPYQVVLWDTQADKVVTNVHSDYFSIFPFGKEPVWSPDGSQFVMAIDLNLSHAITPTEELYGINRDGQINKLTYLTNQYSNIAIDNYSWSPDSRYIAFWLSGDPTVGMGENLTVLDTQTLEVTNYCIPGYDNGPYAAAPIWSPDGHQLIVENIDNNSTQSKVILVDLERGFAAKIANDLVPVGWLNSP